MTARFETDKRSLPGLWVLTRPRILERNDGAQKPAEADPPHFSVGEVAAYTRRCDPINPCVAINRWAVKIYAWSQILKET
jgi:hypothetical protein